jgi:hypothetical protein
MRRTADCALALVAMLAAAPPGAPGQVAPEVRAKAAGIFAALRDIKAERGRAEAALRNRTFTEAEFNAYVACRLDEEKDPYVRSAEFKLLAEDRVEGRIVIDLGDRQSAGVLPKRQDLLFAARFETRDGLIKINMDKIYLGTQPIAPAVVDLIIGVVSRLQGVEPTTLQDWYELPPGVKKLGTRPGQVVVYY